MTPQAFAADLATIPAMDDLTVRICSGGGDVWAAQAIGAMLENRLGTVTAQIEGICASAATIVASHCKVVKAAEDATYMIHPIKVNPNGFVDMEGLKQLMDALTVMRTNVLNQYAKKTGHTVEEVAAWMDATSWWTAAEAKENGFIDEITESNQTAKIENRNGALFVNSIAVPGTFDDAPEFVRNRAVVAPATTEGFVNNTDPAGKPDKNDGGNDMEFKNADELRNGCPDLVKEIVDEAHAEAQNSCGVRPAFILPSTLVVSDDGTVSVNTAPTVSTDGAALGRKNAAFAWKYTVRDADGDTLTVTEKLDGKTAKTRTGVASGTALTFEQTASAAGFQKILNGNHTITVEVSDGKETVSTSATFTKAVHAASVTLAEPLAVEGDITVAVLQVTGSIPDDAKFKAEVTNNALDSSPVWQDATTEVKKGVNIVFENKTATNGAAFNFRVSVERGESGEGGYIEAVSGAFQ